MTTTERLTYGFQMSVTHQGNPNEPITVSNVKSHLSINFSAHDAEITKLITACREQVEKHFHKSLIGHDVSVLWQSFFDDEPLPYTPLHNNPHFTVTDLDDVVISSDDYKLFEVGGSASFKGDFPNGVKLTYKTQGLDDNNINQRLIEAVGYCLHQELTSSEAVKKAFRDVKF
jgi:hypothetical protein